MKIGKIVKLEDAPKGKRLIVCGGRHYGRMLDAYESEAARKKDEKRVAAERAQLFKVLDALQPTEIAEGEARGADTLAREWAESRGVPCSRFPAFWTTEKGAAGPNRNRRMFAGFEPDGTVAFPGGTGTADMENVTLDGGKWLVRVR